MTSGRLSLDAAPVTKTMIAAERGPHEIDGASTSKKANGYGKVPVAMKRPRLQLTPDPTSSRLLAGC